MSPQSATILAHLRAHGSISNVEANAVYKCRSVSRRITEIVRAGHMVGKDYRKDATGQKYVRYVYLGPLRAGMYVNTAGVASYAMPAR